MPIASFDFSSLTSTEEIQSVIEQLNRQLEESQTSSDFSARVTPVRDRRITERMEQIHPTVAQYETVNAAFEVSLNDILQDEEESSRIVSLLDRCRREGNFTRMISVYAKYRQTNIKTEEMLKVLCAVYRLKVKTYNNTQSKSNDRSIVRHGIRCPECGEYALRLVQYLELQGIKWEE